MLLGDDRGTPFYIGALQFEYWQHTQLLIDVVPGRGGGFSLEAPLGVRFLTRSRVFDAGGAGLARRLSRTPRTSAVARDYCRYLSNQASVRCSESAALAGSRSEWPSPG